MKKRDIRMLCLGWMIGTPLTLLAFAALYFLALQEHAFVNGTLLPCKWTIRIEDQHGQPVPGVELVVIDRKTGKPWGAIGNWSGPGSVYTDETGQATFELDEAIGFGGERLYLWGYTKDSTGEPAIVMLYRGYGIFTTPLVVGRPKSVTIAVVRDLSHLPPWVEEERR